MSIATSERPAGGGPSGSHHHSFIRSRTTPLYVVCSPRRSVGKTLLSRLLIEFCDLDDRPVRAFDLNAEGPQLADFMPDRTTVVDINDIYDQMALFDALIADNNTTQVIDLGHQNFRNFFIVAQKIGFFEEVRRHAIEPLLLFMVDPDPASAKAYSILQHWFADVPLLPVRNRAVSKGMLDRDAFPTGGAVSVSPQLPVLQPSLKALVEQPAFSFAQFWCNGLEHYPAHLEKELRLWTERVFSQFWDIETSLACGDDLGSLLEREAGERLDRVRQENETALVRLQAEADARVEQAQREAEERMRREMAEAADRIARLRDEVAQARQNSEQLSAEAAAGAEQIALLQSELRQARQIAQDSSAEADARIKEIRKEADERIARMEADTDERLARMEADTDERLARAQAEIEGTFIRLETELATSKQRADRAEEWLSRIRDQIEGELVPSFTAPLEGRTKRSHREF